MPPAPTAVGSFVELQCAGDHANFIVDTAEGKKSYRADDPEKIVVVGREGGKVDLQCGPQKPVGVKIEYGPPGAQDGDGLIKVIYFDK
jgi:hypothetical protein